MPDFSAPTDGDRSITWNFTAVEGGTQVEQFAEGEPKGFFASLAAPLLQGNLQKQLLQDGENFKRLVESSEEQQPASR